LFLIYIKNNLAWFVEIATRCARARYSKRHFSSRPMIKQAGSAAGSDALTLSDALLLAANLTGRRRAAPMSRMGRKRKLRQIK
jgi:hypothetical protein